MPFESEFEAADLPLRKFAVAEGQDSAGGEGEADVARCGCPLCSGAVIDPDGIGPSRPVSFLDADERGGTGPNGKPSKTVAEAAYWLNRTYASWNDFWTQPGKTDVENKWDDPYWGGAPSYVTFAFRSTAPASMPDDTTGFYRFSEQQIQATLLALQSWSDVANVVFNRVGAGTTGEGAYSNSATMLFGNYTAGAEGAAAFAYYPSGSASGGDVWINTSYDDPVIGNYAMLALIHEIGHAIGFSHPGEYNAGAGVTITYSANAEYYEDSRQYTVMSYFSASNTGANHGGAYAATILLDDIAAAQRTYGVNTTTRTGDTVYGFNSTADRPWFLASTASTKLIFAVWDAGGVDTLDFSGYSQNQVITLIAGHFSNVGGLTGNVAIAIGATIENAIGGSGADTLIGNSVANRLTGNAGADTLTGNGGADIFVITVGGGADTITDFTLGSDLVDVSAFGGYLSIVQSGADALVTVAAGVTVTLLNVTATALTAANFILGGSPSYNVINGTASGETLNGTTAADQISGLAGNDTLNGDAGDDILDGGADNDTLNGGTGADAMTGGTGNDTYVVDNAGDTVTEAASGGTDTVQTSLASYTLGSEVENLTGTVGTGQSLTGNGLANVITGGAGADTLNGAGGDDTLSGGTGADAMTGGTGNDTYVVDNAGDTVTEAASGGTDTVQTSLASYTLGSEVETLTGTVGTGQSLTGNGLANSITGGAGADTITGAAGDDSLRGNGGADVFVATAGGGADTVADFVVGTDKIDVSAFGAYQSIAQDGADTVVTVAPGVTFRLTGVTASTVTGASFIGLAGPNVITGTTANNVLNGTAGVDQISGLGGNDTLRGGGGDDEIDGGVGADKLYGDDGDDALLGGDGSDLLDGGVGADEMSGGLGGDTYVVDNAGDVVIEGADVAKDTVQTALSSYILPANVEVLKGTSGAGQALTGNASANTITAGAGVDTIDGLAGADIINAGGGGDTVRGGGDADKLYGEGGDDFLFGGDGNDTLQGGDGADTLRGEAGSDNMTGGAGADIFVVTAGGGADTVTDFVVGTDRIDLSAYGYYTSIVQSGTATLITFVTGVSMKLLNTTATSITNDSFIGLPTGGGYTEITGTAATETILGTGLDDHILGLEGVDTIKAGAGDDWIEGGADGDKLFGEGGNDLIEGGLGNDNMQGGDGDDRFIGGAGADAIITGAGADVVEISLVGGADVVTDFVVGTDRIDLTAYGAYVSITQKNADTLITFAPGVTVLLKNVVAASITDASFIGLSSPAPLAGSKPEMEPGSSSLIGAAGDNAPVALGADPLAETWGRGLSHAWENADPARDAFHSGWLI